MPQPQCIWLSASTVSVGQAEDLGDLADRAFRAIGDDSGGEPGAVAAVLVVDVLHHLFAPLVLEIDVDIGRLVALGGEEAPEDEIGRSRVDLGDLKAIADHRVGRRAAALAEDVAAHTGMADDVVDGEEVGCVLQLSRSV